MDGMDFYEKLDLLMKLTGTTNSALARYTALDASYVSRLRRGMRAPVENAVYVRGFASYFSRQFGGERERKILRDVLRVGDLPGDNEGRARLIGQWLVQPGTAAVSGGIEGFLGGFSGGLPGAENNSKRPAPTEPEGGREVSGASDAPVSLYQGGDAKRQAVLVFLSLVLQASRPGELLLYSDEPMDWLTDDPGFAARWAALLVGVIGKGNRIRIVHTVSRNLDEMLAALSKWIPLYMTGAIEPYYYPRKRDGVFGRTLFVSPGVAAVSATSTGETAGQAPHFLVRDPEAVEGFAREFRSYLSLCRPLMRIFTPRQQDDYLETLKEFEGEEGDVIFKTEGLSLNSLPEAVARSLSRRIEGPAADALMAYFLNRKQAFEASLVNRRYTEIISLPEVSAIREGAVALQYPGVLEVAGLICTPDEVVAHLEHVIDLLERFPRYQVVLARTLQAESYKLYVKENLGAIVVRTSPPYTVFAFNETNMTGAFWDYLSLMARDHRRDRKEVIQTLRNLIGQLGEAKPGGLEKDG